ncbi:MAG: hypothetical protein QG622_1763 [Actinomycetota bacterium]|nr:hypothetical protein [Actinomycetota bacterium]
MTWHLAQLNVARPMRAVDGPAPELTGFFTLLVPVRALADDAPGFVWQLPLPDGGPVRVPGCGDGRIVVNLSVWESVHALADFVYGPEHAEMICRSREWFVSQREEHAVLWWVPKGHVPDLDEAFERRALLQRRGPSPAAFCFRKIFDPPADPAGFVPSRPRTGPGLCSPMGPVTRAG